MFANTMKKLGARILFFENGILVKDMFLTNKEEKTIHKTQETYCSSGTKVHFNHRSRDKDVQYNPSLGK